jgi:hypothetical protein
MLSGVLMRFAWVVRRRPTAPPPVPQTQE